MESTSAELAAALLQWVKTFDLPQAINSWQDLEDGRLLWAILGDIDPEYFSGQLPEIDRKTNENWIPRWQNWKHIERSVTTYIREECEKLPQLSRKLNTDLKAIATNGSEMDMLKIVRFTLLAAMYSPHSNERMVSVMQTLGPKVAQPIAISIGDMEEMDQEMGGEYNVETEPGSEVDYSTDSDHAQRGPSFQRDPELEREEKLIQALQEKRKFELRLVEVTAELEELRERHKTLEDELAESKFALDRRRGRSADDQDLAQLNQRADRDKEYIAELETDLANAKSTLEQQDRQLERLKQDSESKQELRDELQLANTERDELRQRAKANENLKKKIQTLQDQDRTNQSLRRDLQFAQDQLQELDEVRDRCAALEKANEENAQTIANGEQEIFDQKTAKKRLEHEVNVIAQKWEQTRELLNNAQETVRDLEERLGEMDSGGERTIRPDSLDDELAAEASEVDDKRGDAKKKSRDLSTTAESIVLQQKLGIAHSSVVRFEQRCLELLQENLGFKSAMDEAAESANSKGLNPFQHQMRRLENVSKELDEMKSKFVASSTEISDLKHRLEVAERATGHGGAQPVDLEAGIAALKENQARQKYVQELEIAVSDQKALLRQALLGTDALQREAAKIRQGNEYKLVRQQLEVVRGTVATEADQVISNVATNITDKIESSREALSESKKRHSSELEALRSELDDFKTRPPVPPKVQDGDRVLQDEVRHLQRENKLMASAWFDLTCRLQSNTVLLSRRAEGGKSWLGRMRTMVNTSTMPGQQVRA